MLVQATVRKWGNSLGIRLKQVVADQLNLHDGSRVDINVSEEKLIVTPSAPQYSLKELVDKINARNLHGEVDTGHPAGAEIW